MSKFKIIKKSRKKSEDIDEKIEYLDKECQKTGLQEVMTTSGMYFASRDNPAIPAVTANVPDPTGVLGSGFTPPIGGNGNANDPSNFPAAYDTAWMYNPNDVDGESNRPIVKTMDQSVIDAYNTAFPDDNRFPSGGAGIVFGNIAFGTAVGYASGGHFIQVLNPGLFGNGSTKIVPGDAPFGAPWFGMNSLYFPATIQLAGVIKSMSSTYMSLGGYNTQDAMTVLLWRRHSTFHDGQWDNWSGKKYIDSTTNNRYVLQNFYMHKAANDYVKEPAQPPTTTVLYRDDLGNPIYIPIDSMSSQAYQYLYGRAKGSNVASSGANYDLYNWILKTYGMPAAEWYLKTGKSQGNPYLPGGAYVPRASNPNQPPSPLAGAQDGDEFAFLPFGGNKGNQGFDPTKKQNRRNTINLINAVNSGDPLYLPPGVTMDQAQQWVDNYNNGNLSETFKLRHLKRDVKNEDVNDNTKFNVIKKSRKKSNNIDEKIEYLNKECKKTGLQEIMSTSGMYQGSTKVPNQNYNDFSGLSQGGYGFGLSGGDGNGAGGGSVGVIDDTVSNCAGYMGLSGVAISPPHPITGQRKCARTQTGFAGFFSPLRPGQVQTNSGIPSGGALWFFDPLYNFGGEQGRWLNFQWHPTQNAWAFWDTNFLGFFFLNTNLDQYQLHGNNLGTEIKNKILGLNFGTNGAIGEPQTTVLTKNDLGNPTFLPINIPDLSGEAFNYLKNKSKNVASDKGNYDLYMWMLKTYPNKPEAAEWYLKTGKTKNNPFLPYGSYVPLASNPNQPPSPLAGAQDGDEFAFLPFGGNNKTPEKPTKRTNKGTFDAQRASSGMYPNMTPEKFFQKYGMSYDEYLNLP